MKYRIRKAHLKDLSALTDIWEKAVSETHDFLSPEDFEFYRSRLAQYFDHVRIFVYECIDGPIAGFAGISGDNLEMLFVSERGKGIGKTLLDFAVIQELVTKVSVNSQNAGAFDFYNKYGFREISRSETDSEGKPYPIINMELQVSPGPPTQGYPHEA